MREVFPSGHDGFTITELMLVLAVISLLALAVRPVLYRVRTETRQAVCRNSQRVVRDALEEWASAYALTNGAPTRREEVLSYIRGGVVPVCPEGSIAIRIPATVGQPVVCPNRMPSHLIPDD